MLQMLPGRGRGRGGRSYSLLLDNHEAGGQARGHRAIAAAADQTVEVSRHSILALLAVDYFSYVLLVLVLRCVWRERF